MVGRVLGWLLVLAALVVLVVDVTIWLKTGAWRLNAVGEIWAHVHRNSLLLAEPAIDRHVWPGLWQAVFVPILLLPAAPLLAILGLLLLLLFRRRHKRSGLRD